MKNKPLTVTQGSTLLREWLQTHSYRAIMYALDVSAVTIHYWGTGRCIPRSQRWQDIQKLTGIPVLAWTQAVQ